MLKSPSPNGDSLYSQVPPENAAQKEATTSERSSSFDDDDCATGAEIAQTGDKASAYGQCVKNEPLDNSADLLLDDSLRLQIERSIEIVVNEFSLDSTSSATSADGGDTGAGTEKLNQCVVDSSSAPEQPPANSTPVSAHQESVSCAMDTNLTPTTQSEAALYSNRAGNVKSEPRDANQRSISMKETAPSQALTAPDMPKSSAIDVKPFSGALRSSCLYSSAMKASKDVEFALTPSVTMSSMAQPKVCTAPIDKMNNLCQVSVKPISRSLPPTSYASHSLGSTFMPPSSFPDCCDPSKLGRSNQFAAESQRYQLDAFSGCVIRKTEPTFSCTSSLPTSTSPSTACFCTNSCYGKPCSRLSNQLMNSSLSQRALNLHNSYDLYPKAAAPAQSFDYYRPKSSGPSCFRVPSSPVSRYNTHLPAKEAHMPAYTSATLGSEALGPKSPSFFPSSPSKSLKNWNGSGAATTCMLQNSTTAPYKFQVPRVPSSPSALTSGYVHSSPMTAAAPAFPAFADPSNVSTPRLYNGGTSTSLMNASTTNGLKSPQHPLQQYQFGSSLQKSQCCFPSQLQCYTNCCKEAQQQFSFV